MKGVPSLPQLTHMFWGRDIPAAAQAAYEMRGLIIRQWQDGFRTGFILGVIGGFGLGFVTWPLIQYLMRMS